MTALRLSLLLLLGCSLLFAQAQKPQKKEKGTNQPKAMVLNNGVTIRLNNRVIKAAQKPAPATAKKKDLANAKKKADKQPFAEAIRISSGRQTPSQSPALKTTLAPYLDAMLRPDSRENLLLRQARSQIQAGQYRQAMESMDEAFQLNPNAMIGLTEDEFHPIAKACRILLSSMPENALNAYRLMADPPALRKLESWAKNADEKVLNEVYRGSFFSSLGDDAAYRIGCLFLDQGRYQEAQRALLDAAYVHPSSSIDLHELLPRLTLACYRAGDLMTAKKAWKHFTDLSNTIPAHWKGLEEMLSKNKPAAGFSSKPAERVSWYPPFADGLKGETVWIPKWTAGKTETLVSGARKLRKANLFADDGLSVNGDEAYHRGDTLRSIRLSDGHLNWENSSLAGTTQRHYFYNQNTGQQADWARRTVNVCGDHVMGISSRTTHHYSQSYMPNWMVAVDSKTGKTAWVIGKSGDRRYHYRAQPDEKGGKLAFEDGGKTATSWLLKSRRFRSAPVMWRNHALLVYESGEGLILAAIDPKTQIPVWQTHLFSTLPDVQGCGLYITTDALHAYLCTDDGDIAAIDATTGAPRWFYKGFYRQQEMPSTADGKPADKEEKKKEPRDPADGELGPDGDDTDGNGGGAQPEKKEKEVLERTGWEDSTILAMGERLVAFPHNHPFIVAFDKRKGKRLWMVLKQEDTSYVLGHKGDLIVVAGHKMVRAVDARTGKERWNSPCEYSMGRGFIAGDSVFVPAGKGVRKLALATGKLEASIKVTTPRDVPVANIHPCGEDLLISGLGCVYRVENASDEMQTLEERIAAKATGADLYRRGHIRVSMGKYESGITDLHKALGLLKDKELRNKAKDRLMYGLAHGKLRNPKKWFDMVAKHDFSNKQVIALGWMQGHHYEQTNQDKLALELYRKALSKPDRIRLEGKPGDDTWFVSSKYAIWSRIKAITNRNNELKGYLRLVERDMVATARKAMHKDPLIVAELANLHPDALAVDMVDVVINHLTKEGYPGVAAMFCKRLMARVKKAPLRQHATLQYFRKMGMNLPLNVLQTQLKEVREKDGKWCDDSLIPALKQMGVNLAPTNDKTTTGTPELAWQSDGGMPVAVASNGIHCIDHRTSKVSIIDPKTGKILRRFNTPRTQIYRYQMTLPFPVAANAQRSGGVEFVDCLSGKVVHRSRGRYNGQSSPEGYFPIVDSKGDGTIQLLDPILKQVIWERRELSVLGSNWGRPTLYGREVSFIKKYRRGQSSLGVTFAFPAGEMREGEIKPNRSSRGYYVHNPMYVNRRHYRIMAEGKDLVVRYKNQVIYKKPVNAKRRWFQWQVAGKYLGITVGKDLLILVTDGTKRIDKPLYSGPMLGRLSGVIGGDILFSKQATVNGKRISCFGLLSPTTKKVTCEFLPFRKHLRPMRHRYRNYQYYHAGNLHLFYDRADGHVIAYRLKPKKGE